MRDPLSWSIPLFRAFGIPVRVHLLFFLVVIPLCLRTYGKSEDVLYWWDVFGLWVGVLFGVVLLHEFGHCYGARKVGGEARDVLIWPLGGLASLDLPHRWGAHMYATVAGPAVNVIICAVCALALLTAGYVPSPNPTADPYLAEMYNIRKERTYVSEYGVSYHNPATGETQHLPGVFLLKAGAADRNAQMAQKGFERLEAPLWAVWTYRVFYVSWLLFLFNLIPAFPMDGGRVLQAALWSRGDYRWATTVACYTGYVCGFLLGAVAMYHENTMLLSLAFFIFTTCWYTLFTLDAGESGPFGYDFSAGYTSLERDEDEPPKPKQPGRIARWLAARKARKLQKEQEEAARDAERVDELLDKIARSGKASLTDEEKRFLERASARYRNRS